MDVGGVWFLFFVFRRITHLESSHMFDFLATSPVPGPKEGATPLAILRTVSLYMKPLGHPSPELTARCFHLEGGKHLVQK